MRSAWDAFDCACNVRNVHSSIWFFGIALLLLVSGCSLGYRVDDSELENRKFRLGSNQIVVERIPNGSFAPISIDTSSFGVVYIVNDSVRFDEIGSGRTLTLFPPSDSLKPSIVKLSRVSLEADVITIPLRYRFPRGSIGGTMPESTNLARYGGVRFENYKLSYRTFREGTTRETRRMGYGVGTFLGVTPVAVGAEIDLPALMVGAGAMLDVGGVSFGAAFGIDHLLHEHHDEWHYEGALWTGLWLGLKLN